MRFGNGSHHIANEYVIGITNVAVIAPSDTVPL